MLGWLRGDPRPDSGVDAVGTEAGNDTLSRPEPPETPAPIFAIRAFKTAIFGTPHDADNAFTTENAKDFKSIEHGDLITSLEEKNSVNPNSFPTMVVPSRTTSTMSPTKPAGILLTPGTAPARRKTVSFGATVIDNEARGRTGLPSNFPGKYPSPFTPREAATGGKRVRTNLTNSLYEARTKEPADAKAMKDTKAKQTVSQAYFNAGRVTGRQESTYQKPVDDFIDLEEDVDITIDMQNPQSGSGKFWKTEYEQYQEKTGHEMKKLVKYKQLARSYAKEKDLEAATLGAKLREERKKVAEMEERISKLAVQMAVSGIGGDGATAGHSDHMIDQLVRQTALALEYKDKVDRFQAALEQHGIPVQQDDSDIRKSSLPCTEDTLLQVGQELKKAREQLKEMSLLRLEVDELRRGLKGAERKAQKLEEDNASLSQDLKKAKDELERSDDRRIAREEKHRLREEKLEAQRKEYKDRLLQAKKGRKTAEERLKSQFGEERLKLEKEISTLKSGQVSSTAPKSSNSGSLEKLQQQCLHQQKTIEDYKKQVEDLTLAASAARDGKEDPLQEWQQQQRKTLRELRQAREEASSLRVERDSMETELHKCQAEVRSLKAQQHPSKQGEADLRSSKTNGRATHELRESRLKLFTDNEETPGWPVKAALAKRSTIPDSALLDMNINASYENLATKPLSPEKAESSFLYRTRRLSLDLPLPVLPSPENFVVSKGGRGRNKTHAPCVLPSCDIPSNPPRLHPYNLPLNTATTTSRPVTANTGAGICRSESLKVARPRTNLPPERAAAAKARLAEKRRLQERGLQKENVGLGQAA